MGQEQEIAQSAWPGSQEVSPWSSHERSAQLAISHGKPPYVNAANNERKEMRAMIFEAEPKHAR
jgi:hypothetical protein